MIDRDKKNILGILVDAVDYEAAIFKIMAAAIANKNMTVSALAVHGVMTGVFNSTYRYRINHLDLVVPETISGGSVITASSRITTQTGT